jgi:hypothetical protein
VEAAEELLLTSFQFYFLNAFMKLKSTSLRWKMRQWTCQVLRAVGSDRNSTPLPLFSLNGYIARKSLLDNR